MTFFSRPVFPDPEQDRVAYGTNVEQLAGIVSVTGYEAGVPQKSGISFGDPMAGTAAVALAAFGWFLSVGLPNRFPPILGQWPPPGNV